MLSILLPVSVPVRALLDKNKFCDIWILEVSQTFTDPVTGLVYTARPDYKFAERTWDRLQKNKHLGAILTYPENMLVWCQSVSDKQVKELQKLPRTGFSIGDGERLTERHNRELRTVLEAGKVALFANGVQSTPEKTPASKGRVRAPVRV